MKAAKIVTDAIIGNDFKTIVIGDIPYTIYPPTINRIAGSISCLSDIEIPENVTFKDVFSFFKDSKALAMALSWMIKGDDSLSEKLGNGTHEEVVNGLVEAFSLIPSEVFTNAVSLMKSASLLAARPKL